ncbi:MAG: sulfotransferase domain-containing protein [Myxococcota bacterium]
MSDAAQPTIYQTWTTDSRRWQHYRRRPGDIIIGTYPKCGTTWTQRIVDLLVFQSPEARSILDVSPWIDMRFGPPIEEVIARADAQQHRRFFKSHLPFDGLPCYEDVRYIHVARDGRDACMSFFNHCSAYTPQMYEAMDRGALEMGAPAPRCPDDVRVFFHEWLTKGIHPGLRDGFPTHSFFDFENTWWNARERSNVLLVHYNDLTADLDGEMRRIAGFLSIDVNEGIWPELVEAATFDDMKRKGSSLLPMVDVVFEGGTDRFLYKGSNERWRGAIPAEDLALYEELAGARFSEPLGRWIENGRLKAGDPGTAPD